MIALVLSIAWDVNDIISFKYSMGVNDSISFKYSMGVKYSISFKYSMGVNDSISFKYSMGVNDSMGDNDISFLSIACVLMIAFSLAISFKHG